MPWFLLSVLLGSVLLLEKTEDVTDAVGRISGGDGNANRAPLLMVGVALIGVGYYIAKKT